MMLKCLFFYPVSKTNHFHYPPNFRKSVNRLMRFLTNYQANRKNCKHSLLASGNAAASLKIYTKCLHYIKTNHQD